MEWDKLQRQDPGKYTFWMDRRLAPIIFRCSLFVGRSKPDSDGCADGWWRCKVGSSSFRQGKLSEPAQEVRHPDDYSWCCLQETMSLFWGGMTFGGWHSVYKHDPCRWSHVDCIIRWPICLVSKLQGGQQGGLWCPLSALTPVRWRTSWLQTSGWRACSHLIPGRGTSNSSSDLL